MTYPNRDPNHCQNVNCAVDSPPPFYVQDYLLRYKCCLKDKHFLKCNIMMTLWAFMTILGSFDILVLQLDLGMESLGWPGCPQALLLVIDYRLPGYLGPGSIGVWSSALLKLDWLQTWSGFLVLQALSLLPLLLLSPECGLLSIPAIDFGWWFWVTFVGLPLIKLRCLPGRRKVVMFPPPPSF